MGRASAHALEAKVWTQADKAAFTQYCMNYARWAQAEDELDKLNGQWVSETPNGFQTPTAWWKIRCQAQDQMLKFITEFGLSPVSRAKLGWRVPKSQLNENARPRAGEPDLEEFLAEDARIVDEARWSSGSA